MQILRAEVFYWKVENPKHFKPEVFPCENGKEHFYIFPEFEYPGLLKVSWAVRLKAHGALTCLLPFQLMFLLPGIPSHVS